MIVATPTPRYVPRYLPHRRGLGAAGISMPAGTIGPWTPPGKTLVSPPISPTAASWPPGPTAGQPAYPQFVSTDGQQIGAEFFPFGTYLCPAGVTSGKSCGYLSPPASPSSKYGTPILTVNPQVMSPNNWQGIEGQPYTQQNPPSAAAASAPPMVPAAPSAPAPAPVSSAAPVAASVPSQNYVLSGSPAGSTAALQALAPSGGGSSFDLSSIPWWAWAGAAALGLYLVVK